MNQHFSTSTATWKSKSNNIWYILLFIKNANIFKKRLTSLTTSLYCRSIYAYLDIFLYWVTAALAILYKPWHASQKYFARPHCTPNFSAKWLWSHMLKSNNKQKYIFVLSQSHSSAIHWITSLQASLWYKCKYSYKYNITKTT